MLIFTLRATAVESINANRTVACLFQETHKEKTHTDDRLICRPETRKAATVSRREPINQAFFTLIKKKKSQ